MKVDEVIKIDEEKKEDDKENVKAEKVIETVKIDEEKKEDLGVVKEIDEKSSYENETFEETIDRATDNECDKWIEAVWNQKPDNGPPHNILYGGYKEFYKSMKNIWLKNNWSLTRRKMDRLEMEKVEDAEKLADIQKE